MVDQPSSLHDPALRPLWLKIRERLDRFGRERRGRLKVPTLSDSAMLTLFSLLDQKPTSSIQLEQLESALCKHGLAQNLHDALTSLGAAEDSLVTDKRKQLQRRQDAQSIIQQHTAHWQEDWRTEWNDWLFRFGLMASIDATEADKLATNTRKLLDHLKLLESSQLTARNDIAANLFGSAHALDDGTLLERASRRALWCEFDSKVDYADGRQVWHEAGITTDSISTPVLVWQLALNPETALGKLCSSANDACIPLHLSHFALSRHKIEFNAPEKPVYVFENPRLLEAAAEKALPHTVITTNGNPASSVITLITSLINQGATVFYHGDFDAAGIAICRRMVTLGCTAWKMRTEDYLQGLNKASARQLGLPEDEGQCGPTPWDINLQQAMQTHRRVVHEELMLEELLGCRHHRTP